MSWISRPLAIATVLSLLAALLTSANAAESGAFNAISVEPAKHASDSDVRYRSVDIDGLKIFYREVGSADAPVILLLHGFPACSFMFRDLMNELSGKFRLIAPDYPGFGYSDAPSTQAFAYTFDNLADVIEKFAGKLSLDKYALYMQDFGGPVGFRIAARQPKKISFLIVQNANAYEEGLPDTFWAPARVLWRNPTPENYERIRAAALSDTALEWNYTHGVKDVERISPESWVLQRGLLSRQGNKDAMLALLYDYRTNLARYPEWHRYFRAHQPPMLIVWGKNDIIFPAPGAHAYLRDVPHAELHLLDTGHFALEDHAKRIATLTYTFYDRVVEKR
jgi:pimeloyl-ACP methyl ester carboxylesterase